MIERNDIGEPWLRASALLRQLAVDGKRELGELEIRDVLTDTSIRFAPTSTVQSPEEAVATARLMGFPVVMKLFVVGHLHKSDLGMVRTNLFTPDAVWSAAAELIALGQKAASQDAVSLGVQKQVTGIELAIGIRRDVLGLVCMVAAGGTLIELLGDRAVAFGPLNRQRALEMLKSLKIWPLLNGYRGSPHINLEKLVDLMMQVSELGQAVPELFEFELNPVFVSVDECVAVDAAGVVATWTASTEPTPDGSASLALMMNARRIMIVGSTGGPLKVGSLLVRYLRKHQYKGELVLVSGKATRLDGVEVYASVAEVPGQIDLACIAVPRELVADVVTECIHAGVPTGVIYTSGFAEVGGDGIRLQEELVNRASGRFRFIGPNSIGVASVHDGILATFGMALEATIEPGSLGFVSQSGAIASSLVSRAREFGLSFSRWISVGNEADLGVADCIENLVADPKTEAIGLFLEVVRQPVRFRRACLNALVARKPIIAVKTGKSEVGRLAAASHTAALTGSDVAYESFLRDCGVLRVDHLSGLFIAARALQAVGPVAGNRVAVVTMSGGIASLVADACSQSGIELPSLSDGIQRHLRSFLPEFASVRNPIDITAVGISNPDFVRRSLSIIRQSGEVDLVLVQFTTNADPGAAIMAQDLLAARDEEGCPFLVGRLGSADLAPNAMSIYTASNLPVFDWPNHLVQGAAACITYGRVLGVLTSTAEGTR